MCFAFARPSVLTKELHVHDSCYAACNAAVLHDSNLQYFSLKPHMSLFTAYHGPSIMIYFNIRTPRHLFPYTKLIPLRFIVALESKPQGYHASKFPILKKIMLNIIFMVVVGRGLWVVGGCRGNTIILVKHAPYQPPQNIFF